MMINDVEQVRYGYMSRMRFVQSTGQYGDFIWHEAAVAGAWIMGAALGARDRFSVIQSPDWARSKIPLAHRFPLITLSPRSLHHILLLLSSLSCILSFPI